MWKYIRKIYSWMPMFRNGLEEVAKGMSRYEKTLERLDIANEKLVKEQDKNVRKMKKLVEKNVVLMTAGKRSESVQKNINTMLGLDANGDGIVTPDEILNFVSKDLATGKEEVEFDDSDQI